MGRDTLRRRVRVLEGTADDDHLPRYILAEVQDFAVSEPGEVIASSALPADRITFGSECIERLAGESENGFIERALAAYRLHAPNAAVPVLMLRRAG